VEPGKVQVMEPVLENQVPLGKNKVYQVKWDGVRMLAFVRQGQVVLQNRNGRLKTDTFPELRCLGELGNQPLVLDGEVVSIKDGRPDFGMILRRNFLTCPGPGAPPISYVIFDILCLQGKDMRSEILEQRQGVLGCLRLPPGPVSIIDNFADGEKLMSLTTQRGWEGIVAKDINSPYVPGKSTYWIKIKNRQTEVFYILGYVLKQGQLASIIIGKDLGSGMKLTGSVGSGLSAAGRRILLEIMHRLDATDPPAPGQKKKENWHWVKPVLQVKVEFMEWTESLTVRAPVFRGLYLEGKRYELP